MITEDNLRDAWLKAKQEYDDAQAEWEIANNLLHDYRRKYEAAHRAWNQYLAETAGRSSSADAQR